MKAPIRNGLVGDFDRNFRPHPATDQALVQAANRLSVAAATSWLPTPHLLRPEGEEERWGYHGLRAVPGSPYRGLERAIRVPRERGRPFVAPRGGVGQAAGKDPRKVPGPREGSPVREPTR